MTYNFSTDYASPSNYTKGRQRRLDTIVIHHWGDPAGHPTLEGVVAHFKNPNAQVSAHYVVEGGRVVQMVPDGDTAWHAGNWGENSRAIGIECNPRCSEDDKRTVGELIANLQAKYGISRIIGHRDASATACPGRYYPPAQVLGPYIKSGGGAVSAPAASSAPSGDIDSLARRTIAGEFGNGDARRAALGSQYDAVQARVNELLGAGGGSAAPSVDIDDLARRTIAGEFGNGDARRAALGGNYDAVQNRVNELLGAGGGASSGPDLNALADAVIRGDYGNGAERRRRLGGLYDAVQAIVNQKLGG